MKKNSLIRFISALTVLIIFSTSSYGQYKGPGSADKFYTIAEIKDNASELDRKDVMVKVQGFIVKQINKDTYEFKDDTGTIQVDIDKKKLPDSPFDDKTEIILIGEVDNDLLEPVEIEAEEVIINNLQ